MPMGSHGVGGRVGNGQQHAIIKGLTKDTRRGNHDSIPSIGRYITNCLSLSIDEDPRAALLKYSTDSPDGTKWVSNGKE